jgi:uncharacterized protein
VTIRSLMRVGALALAMASLGGFDCARAQSAPAAGGQPPMVLPVISPSHVAIARAVVISSGLSRSFDSVVPELMGQLFANVTQTRPELANDLKAVLTQLQPEFQSETGALIDAAAQSVAGQIDEADLTRINAFFTSPAGKKYVDAQPEMLDHMMTSVHDLTQQMSQEMMSRVRQELQKRGKQL